MVGGAAAAADTTQQLLARGHGDRARVLQQRLRVVSVAKGVGKLGGKVGVALHLGLGRGFGCGAGGLERVAEAAERRPLLPFPRAPTSSVR
jgi:hypothetical protein